MYIEQVNSPEDLKKLNREELSVLAGEIRSAILQRCSQIGGHLASNLGMVETTIALHYVFNSPKDKFIFDVSHQCYTHKILTGRGKAFLDPKEYKTSNGFSNPLESEHDFFQMGHTATAISLACGMVKARDLCREKKNIIAIVGDGSLSGGEALEALDYAGGEVNSNLIVVFNDNGRSIAENHGGMYGNFAELRKTEGRCENNLFKAFGFDYRFIRDGHCISNLISAFESVKDIQHPVLIHICTTKGKGYAFSEQEPERTHWIKPFDPETGRELRPFSGERYDYIVRDHLLRKMRQDPLVTMIIAAVPDVLAFTAEKRKEAGNQFIDVGIAEEHAVSLAGGIARNGGKPVFATFSTFIQRTYDQISQELCINRLSATLVVCNASVYAVNDITHIGIFDIPLMSNIPNLVYLAPTNRQEYLAMLDWSIDQREHPVAIRAPRNGVFDAKGAVDTNYGQLNRYQVAHKGRRVAVIALGDFFQMGAEVVDVLREETGIDATLINPRYITGLDMELLKSLSQTHELVVTLEDGILNGGFGEKISSFYGMSSVRVKNYGLQKEFLDSYNLQEVLEKNRLRPDLIVSDIMAYLSSAHTGR